MAIQYSRSKLHICLVLICTSIFIYQTVKSFDAFLKQKPLTKRTLETQESHPLPIICIGPWLKDPGFELHNLTKHGYRNEGKWKSNFPDFDEERTYENLSSTFDDLVAAIGVKRELQDGSYAYEYIEFNSIIMQNILKVERWDYYAFLKGFCIKFPPQEVSYGIQKIGLHLKMNSMITVVAPGNVYSYQRKHTSFLYKPGYIDQYDLYHSISRVLPLSESPCSHSMDWALDSCKLNFINNKIMKTLNCTVPWMLQFARYA